MPILGLVEPRELVLCGGAVADGLLDDIERGQGNGPHVDEIGEDAERLRHELRAVSVEEAAHLAIDAVEPVAIAPVREEAEREEPQIPFAPCTATAPTGSSIFSVCSTNTATTTTSTPATAPMRPPPAA